MPSDAIPLAPRVDMHYRVQMNGTSRRVDLPFVTAVLADLAGQPVEPLPPVADRRFVEVDSEGFEAFMADVAPRLAFDVPDCLAGEGTLAVELRFLCLDDFAPRALVRRIPALLRALASRPGAGSEAAGRIVAQVDAVVHHPALLRLEAAWRSLHRMVQANEPDGLCPIRVLVVGKTEVWRTLRRYKGMAWEQSPIFKRLWTEGVGTTGAAPLGCIVLDHEFDHGERDVEALGELAKIAAACHAPLLAAAAPSCMQMDSWAEIVNPRDLRKIFQTPEYERWRELRRSEQSGWLVLALPRYLERQPWRQEPLSSAGPVYDEAGADIGMQALPWANAAYLLATVIQRSFRIHGWFDRITGIAGGGAVEGLPAPVPKAGLSALPGGPVEAMLDDRRIAQIDDVGLTALAAHGEQGIAVFAKAVTLFEPPEFDDADATRNARLTRSLAHQLILGRIAHFVRAIVRDTVAAGESRRAVQERLDAWMADYTEPQPGTPDRSAGACRPLAAAEVRIEQSPEEAGSFTGRIFVRPKGLPGLD